MKLRNKKTGEIVYATMMASYGGGELQIRYYPVNNAESTHFKEYRSISELNEEWEDYEELKEYWYIDWNGKVCRSDIHDERTEQMKQIGNYFDTEEESELAVRKLKAFRKLKDNGMIKYSFHKEKTGIDLDFYTLTILAPRDKDSLDLLFGGEE